MIESSRRQRRVFWWTKWSRSTAIRLALLVLVLISAIKVAREYERAIVFRLGRLLQQPKDPACSS